MPSDDIMSGEEIRACLERAEAASAAPLSNAEYRDKYGEAWRLVETDVPRLARTALALESQLAHALKLEQRAIDAREELISELRERLAKKGIEEQAAYKAIRGERDALAARCERLARLGRASVALSSAWYALSPDELDPYQREEEEARADCESHGDLEER